MRICLFPHLFLMLLYFSENALFLWRTHLLRKHQCKNLLAGLTSCLVCLPLQWPWGCTSPGRSTLRMSTLMSQQECLSCASMPWRIHLRKSPTSICARISSFLEEDMKIIGSKSKKKQGFSTSAKAWIERTLTCCVSTRRPAFHLFLNMSRQWDFSIGRWASNLENTHLPFQNEEPDPVKPTAVCQSRCWPGTDPVGHTGNSSRLGELHYWKYFFSAFHSCIGHSFTLRFAVYSSTDASQTSSIVLGISR